MCSYACMLQTIDTTKDSFINKMMARNIFKFRLYSSWKRNKNKPSIVEFSGSWDHAICTDNEI